MSTLRIGLVGAGGNTRAKHIPGFKAIDDVEIVAVANRSLASSQAACDEHGIARACAHWREVVADPEVDAICIGTWPDGHAPITIAALEAGKHVLCEARMARTYADAVAMDAVLRARPELVGQIVPAPFTLEHDETIRRLLAEGAIGRLVGVEFRQGLGPCQDPAISGINCMTLGIQYESLLRWVGPARRVAARGQVVTAHRRDGEAHRAMHVYDHLEVLGELVGGGSLAMRISMVAASEPGDGFRLIGSDGSLALRGGELTVQRGGDDPETIPAAHPGWRVEADFVASIRDGTPVRLTDFATGLHYMAFSEAVQRAAASGASEPVPLL